MKFGGAEAHGKTKDHLVHLLQNCKTRTGISREWLLSSSFWDKFPFKPHNDTRIWMQRCFEHVCVCVCMCVTSELVLMIENIELSIPEQMRSSFCCLKCRWMWWRTTGSRILRDSEGTQNRHTSLLQFRFIWDGPHTRYIMAVMVSVDRNPTTSLLFTGTTGQRCCQRVGRLLVWSGLCPETNPSENCAALQAFVATS